MRDASHASDSMSPSLKSDTTKKGENDQAERGSLAEGEKGAGTNSSSTYSSKDEEGFLDISYLEGDILPLVTGELSNVESEEEGNLNTRKRKRASVSADPKSDPSDVGSSRPKKKRRIIEELAAEWGMCVEEARSYSAENIAALRNIATENEDAEVVKKVAAEEGGEASQLKTLFRFEEEAARKKKVGSILDRMDEKRFTGVQKR